MDDSVPLRDRELQLIVSNLLIMCSSSTLESAAYLCLFSKKTLALRKYTVKICKTVKNK